MKMLVGMLFFSLNANGLPGNCAERVLVCNGGSDNPFLVYDGQPMFKTGPISEDRVFMYALESELFDHCQWLDYMQDKAFQFARVYASHTWHDDQSVRDRRPLQPFRVVRVSNTEIKRPVVDLLTSDKTYWHNFAEVLGAAEQRDIVACVQLYPRWYWGKKEPRSRLFYHKEYNTNGVHSIDHRTIWRDMSNDIPDGILWRIHQNYVDQCSRQLAPPERDYRSYE